jgi:hypothetical protein
MSASLPISLTNLRFVSEAVLSERLTRVKTLREQEHEGYFLEKDEETGEHYLHYAVRHIHLAGGGVEEYYHHLMPLSQDDVITLALGAAEYEYPTYWRKPYLRNGPEGGFVWFDPDGAPEQPDQYAQIADEIRARLTAFRQAGRQGEEEVKRLMEEMDRLFERDGRE